MVRLFSGRTAETGAVFAPTFPPATCKISRDPLVPGISWFSHGARWTSKGPYADLQRLGNPGFPCVHFSGVRFVYFIYCYLVPG